jgi:putative glutamine amidotransferase
MSKPPLILVTPGVERHGAEFHDYSLSLSVKYENALLAAGGIPVIAPVTTHRALLAEAVRRADGVMLTGGDDIQPRLYLDKLSKSLRRTLHVTPDYGARDLREVILLDEVFRQRKPLLAICRGHQLLSVALGGKLIVDIPQQLPAALRHRRLDRPCTPVHRLRLQAGSLLATIVGDRWLGANSTHHQAVVEPAEPLVAVARTADGIVEAMELAPSVRKALPFLLSVQFHPERLADRYIHHQRIFRGFVRACQSSK